jgi:hypothetical protein
MLIQLPQTAAIFEIRTPGIQAGLVKKRFSFKDVFTFHFAIFWTGQLGSNPKMELIYGESNTRFTVDDRSILIYISE